MTGVLWVVCDTSGSMVELGKQLIVRSLVRATEQYFRLGHARKAELRLVWWGDVAVPLEWHPNSEVPDTLFATRGSANGQSLAHLLEGHHGSRALVLTDGFWTDDSRHALKELRSRLGPYALRIIKVGADANPRVKGEDVFIAEDLLAALDGWMEPP